MNDRASLDASAAQAVALVPAGELRGALRAPTSKSVTNRLLVIAGLARGTSVIGDPLESDDTEAMLGCLGAFGVEVRRHPASIEVRGSCGVLGAPVAPLDARLSGTTLRYLAAASLLASGPVVLDGSEPLRRRPIAPLADALESLGGEIRADGGRPPLHIVGHGIRGGRVDVDAAASSQFATAVLLVAPFARADLLVAVSGLAAPGYVELTAEVMRRFGAHVEPVGPSSYLVTGATGYAARDEVVEHDASAAAHLFALAVAARGRVTVLNAGETSQPDAALPDVFEVMGAVVERRGGATTVSRAGELHGVDVDLAATPDQVATVAVLGALATGVTRIRNVAVARGHETDRLAAVARELRRVGVPVEELPDGLIVDGGHDILPGRIATYRDHRMAMAFSALGAAVPGIEIADPSCVAKTYPRFFDDVAALGIGVRPIE